MICWSSLKYLFLIVISKILTCGYRRCFVHVEILFIITYSYLVDFVSRYDRATYLILGNA
ncbi:hypothetical protein BDV25DRAFT_71339 [Aspergillus avenaceus]|uniref:Uncharacterized protein n=1 Tax=Aspergillus avenaceus TaxID=36643 RepID=A0A5N6TGB0_ASPAV|nr:hypothetical protein BDV25DRAFT_71339 [Aspergillus avenaceus]